METFEHGGKKYVSINGKDYFLLRGHRRDFRTFIFIQVSGRTPLHKEDLPGKDWDDITSRRGTERVWTAYHRKYFSYDSNAEHPSLAFIGATTKGSYFIAFRHVAKRFGLTADGADLSEIAKQFAFGELDSR